MRHTNSCKYRYFVVGKLSLLSPLILGSGENEIADIQCQRSWDRELFIPGTTLAGNIRHYLALVMKEKKLLEQYFGTREDDSQHSLFSFFDVPLIQAETEIRDGIALNDLTKTVKDKSKYDYEIISCKTAVDFRMEVILREDHTPEDKRNVEAIIARIVAFLQTGDCCLGAKTSRGFGRIKLSEPGLLQIALPEDIKKWIDFSWNRVTRKFDLEADESLFVKEPAQELSATFKIADSLLIRSYSVDPNAVDAVTLTWGGTPVISGTSWNGALRHALANVGRELNRESGMQELVKRLFGYVDVDKRSKEALPSRVVIDESPVTNGKLLPYTRNKIDRFTGGVVNSALFDEMPVYGGEIEFRSKICHPEDHEIGLLILALKELANGIQTVGGDANIGRGRLILREISLSKEKQQFYLNALAAKLTEETPAKEVA